MPTTVLDGPDVWLESEATRQLDAVARLEGCIRAAGMPDLHPGRGFPIGAVVATATSSTLAWSAATPAAARASS